MEHPVHTTCRRAVAALALAACASASAQPPAPVRIVLGVPAGSAPDVVARAYAEAMAPLLGLPVIVENRPGSGGTLATTAVAAAPPDGHVLNVSGCSGDSITHAFVSQGRTPLQPFRDLTPVARLMRDHWLVLISADAPSASLQAFGERARAESQPLAYPSQGEGSTPHLQGARLARAMRFPSLHVSYRDSPLADLVGGRLAYAVLSSGSAMPLVRSGRLQALAVLSDQRLPVLPDVPTVAEAGLPGHEFNGGVCLWAPGATDAAMRTRLNRAVAQAAAAAPVRERLATLGADPTPYTLEETLAWVSTFVAESDRMRAETFGPSR